jgi:putative autotransporter adhesin-like protein
MLNLTSLRSLGLATLFVAAAFGRAAASQDALQNPVAYAQTALAGGGVAVERATRDGQLDVAVARQAAVLGSGVVQRRRIASLASFDRLDVRVGAVAVIEIDPKLTAPAVDLTIDDNLADAIAFRSDGTTLFVEPGRSFRTNVRPQLTIAVPHLSSLSIGGTAPVSVRGLDQKALAVSAAGAADVRLAGSVQAVELNLVGSSSIDTTAMAAESTTVSGLGSTRCTVGESSRIAGRIAGSAKLFYRKVSVVSVAREGAGKIELIP